jgi:Protein kinase domain
VNETDWRHVRDLFEAGLEQPPEDVDRWLRDRCPDDASVRREVGSLLAEHARAGEFLTRPAGDLAELFVEAGDTADEHAESTLVPGRMIGPYQIGAEVGRGGMGRVYRALDTRLHRTVALKALPHDLATDASGRERLRREARAAAGLTHPGICTVHALEEIDGQLYLVTEFIEGRTLRQEIQHGPPPSPAQGLDGARQLAAALASAHAMGVVHRDLKPENVMRATDGRIKILDFGLARVEAVGAGIASLVTQPGTLVGTPAYMAPEQLNGQPVDARTDVFAFGVLMYELSTGAHPFHAETAIARAGRVLEAAPVPIGERRPDFSKAFAAVIDRCLSKQPTDRFASAGELLAALDTAASSTAITAVGDTSTAVGDARRTWWRTHQVAAIGLYLAAVVAAWLVKEWLRGPTSAIFIGMSVVAAIVGVLRGHLVFTALTHLASVDVERQRVERVTLVLDLAIAAALIVDGLLLTRSREVPGVLVLGLAVGVGLARLVLEPATAQAAFGGDESHEGR